MVKMRKLGPQTGACSRLPGCSVCRVGSMGLPPCHLPPESVSFLPITCANHRLFTVPQPQAYGQEPARQTMQHPKPGLGPGVQAIATENQKPQRNLPTSVRENILGLVEGGLFSLGSELQTNQQLLKGRQWWDVWKSGAPRKDTKCCQWAEGDPKVRQNFFPEPRFEVPNWLLPPPSVPASQPGSSPAPPYHPSPASWPPSVSQSRVVSITTGVDIVS